MSATLSRRGGATDTESTKRGWYADPLRTHDERFFDGREWTGETRDRPVPTGRKAGRVLLVASGIFAIALSAVSAATSNDRLAWCAVVVVLPVGVAASVQLVRRHHGHARLSPLHVVLLAWVIVIAVVSVAGYRSVTSYATLSCTDRLGPAGRTAGCNLAGRDLTSYELQNVDLTGADLRGAKLDNVSLGGSNLSGANLDGASLVGAFLSNANLEHARLDGARLDGATFDKADLRGVSMRRVSAVGTTLTATNLTEAKMIDSNLSKARLDGADLHRATVQTTVLTEASFNRTDFADATLTSVTFDGSHLEGVRDLTDAQLGTALGVDPLDVAKRLSDSGLFLEPEDATNATVSAACAGMGVPGAGTSTSNGVFVVIVNNDLSYLQGPNHLPALRYVEAVACVGPTLTDEIQTCGPYFYSDGSPAHGITRYQENVTVTVVNPATAAVVTQQTYTSPPPGKCPNQADESTFTIGTPLDPATLQAGIADLVAQSGL